MTKSIHDSRVVESDGGGSSPEQHWGSLTDGRIFYFRMRHGCAELHVGQPGEELPEFNPLYDDEEAQATYERGEVYPHIIFRPPIGHVDVCAEQDPYRGWFLNDNERDSTFTQCLDQIEAKEKDHGE